MASPPAPSPTSRPCYRSLPHLKAGKGGSGAKVHDCELINTELSTMLFIPVIVNVVDTYKSSSFLEPGRTREENLERIKCKFITHYQQFYLFICNNWN
ncbi:hypothetical protein OIU76_013793 [Salix suchowensis]|nr:hypothetical protein OIU76_013793 [Salix suchowensis]KAJ6318327.1 hypothetical protein OIU76_013793 [Salix suchowensis]